ncbi:thioredoxin family protein [Butyrivibrio sp. JL13D10]|uniref:thioredoxin family protein n=1 Tax=Butyrivibrio sp. JL13D10 TaxID=3236815 RepID=UPI0038B53409
MTKDILLNKTRALVCFYQKGCSMCLEVEPLTDLLEKGNIEIIKISCDEYDELLYEFGGDGTPYWVLILNGEIAKGICPTEKSDDLFSFITDDCGISLSGDEFNKAMLEGKGKREYQEMVVAEILFRSKESNEDSLTYAARLKIVRPCISSETDEELRKCIRENIGHFIKRLRESMEKEGGDTEARRIMLKKLPEMEEDIYNEVKEIKQTKER